MKKPDLGPNGICNIIFKCTLTTLTPYLTHLFNTIFTLNTDCNAWREFTTIVLHKPEKADCFISKTYYLITLLNVTYKLLIVIITE